MAWKKEFDARHKVEKEKGKKDLEVKVTGKEWFLGRQGQEEEEEEESDEESEEEEEEEVRAE